MPVEPLRSTGRLILRQFPGNPITGETRTCILAGKRPKQTDIAIFRRKPSKSDSGLKGSRTGIDVQKGTSCRMRMTCGFRKFSCGRSRFRHLSLKSFSLLAVVGHHRFWCFIEFVSSFYKLNMSVYIL